MEHAAQEIDPEELSRTLHAGGALPALVHHPGPIPLQEGQSLTGVLERALDSLSAGDTGIQKFILHYTDEFVIFYDGMPKASVHLLVVPRERIEGLHTIDICHLQLLKRMAAYVNWVICGVSCQRPDLPGWAHGVHAVPTLRQLHYHVISQDFNSEFLTSSRQFNSFQKPFLVQLDDIIDELEGNSDPRGRFHLDSVHTELERKPCCHRCGREFGKKFEEFKKHLGVCMQPAVSMSSPSWWRTRDMQTWKQEGELAKRALKNHDLDAAAAHLANCVSLRPHHRKSYDTWIKVMQKQGHLRRIAGTRGMDSRVKVVLDMETDDPDDFICLIFLASHPFVNLKAVTITPGSTTQVGLVRWLLQRLGKVIGKDIRVGAGDIHHPKSAVSPWHQEAFFGDQEIPTSSEAEVAWQVLVDECDESTTLFTGGPLLNVAQAIEQDRDNFVVGTWLAQGGFAGVGDGLVAPEDDLFQGRSHYLTTNFGREYGSDVSRAAHTALEHEGFLQRLLVSKNVCHHPSNRFTKQQMDRLVLNLQSAGATSVTSAAMAKSPVPNNDKDRYWLGQSLLALGMQTILGKSMHDPLAAMVVLNPCIIVRWAEVNMKQKEDSTWGATCRDYSNTFISLRHNSELFWTVFLDPPATMR